MVESVITIGLSPDVDALVRLMQSKVLPSASLSSPKWFDFGKQLPAASD